MRQQGTMDWRCTACTAFSDVKVASCKQHMKRPSISQPVLPRADDSVPRKLWGMPHCQHVQA